jgi:hypothetical protein
MDHTEAEYRAILHEALPEAKLEAILLAVVDGYRAAPLACRKALDIPDRHDAFGMIRRGKINEQLRGVCERHSLDFRDESNKNGSAFFLSIFSQQLRLVAHLVGRRRYMVRPAKIRKAWAQYNRDGRRRSLFPLVEEPVPPDVKYVAFLIHGPRGRHRDQPAFVDVVIPDRDFNLYICRLELFKLFPQIANGVVKGQEAQRKQPKPRRRRDTGSV